MSDSGSHASAIRSASLPGAMEPSSFSFPSRRADSSVAARIACSGVIP